MAFRIVFSDVDGTLLNSEHQMLPGTVRAIAALKDKGIPFVIVSGRGPTGIYPILEKNHFSCPLICFSGSLILDDDRRILYETGFTKEEVEQILKEADKFAEDLTWNLYSRERWLVRDVKDPRVINEAEIVEAPVEEGSTASLPEDAMIGKILCICEEEKTVMIEEKMKEAFPAYSIMRSSSTLLEIMPPGVTKGTAIRELCRLWNILPEETVAFGDHYNDVAMLETAAMPILMANAPEELKKRFPVITEDNDHEGIYNELKRLEII